MREILSKIEKQKGIKILYACETGSRAWGFPSPDSDFDVRFIYRHDRDWYLSLWHRKDTIELMEGELDITGWDLRKSLILLKKSNVPLIERFQSPLVYYADEDFKEAFKNLINQYYSPTAAFYHHYSLANKFWAQLRDKDEIKLKHYFYLLRSLLSCNWIVKNTSVLPMDIEGLMTVIETNRQEVLRDLVRLKAGKDEKYLFRRDESLDKWIRELLEFIDTSKGHLGVNRRDNTALNQFFLKTVNDHVDN